MNTIRLKALGELAGEVRRRVPQRTETNKATLAEKEAEDALMREYEHYLGAINNETQMLRQRHPEMFWKDDDPQYKELVSVWAEKRAEQKANGKLRSVAKDRIKTIFPRKPS